VKENHLFQDETNRRALMKKVTYPGGFHKRLRISRLGTQLTTLQEKFRSMEIGNFCGQLWSSFTDVMSILCSCNSPVFRVRCVNAAVSITVLVQRCQMCGILLMPLSHVTSLAMFVFILFPLEFHNTFDNEAYRKTVPYHSDKF
jgi:hypothetical protein